MKFSVAVRIWEPVAEMREECGACWVMGLEVLDEVGSAIVAGRETRMRSVARGHSSWIGKCALWLKLEGWSPYVPLPLKGL